MEKERKPEKYFTFMVIPHAANGNPISLKVPARWVNIAIWAGIFSILVVGSSIIYSTLISRRLMHYADTIAKNREQRQVIKNFSHQNKKVVDAIQQLEESDNELRKLLGLKGWKSKITLSKDKTEIQNNLSSEKTLVVRLSERKKSMDELRSWINQVMDRIASTPSRWPALGRLSCNFGYRIYPWRGFHAGIDISTAYGTPVRSTANGVVESAGWVRGYGKAIVIDHGNGISTLYGHNSAFAAGVGQRVRKGQVICYVGMTGYTTGPHVHYEVRKWGRPVNPVAYLNVNVLSASRLWSK